MILKYLSYVLRHKWFVMIECFKVGLIWRGLVHDLDKFFPSLFFPYANHFKSGIQKGRDKTGYYKPYNSGDPDFDLAVHQHTQRNKHHWQFWVQPIDVEGVKLHPMPEIFIKEMICDWEGASKAQGVKTGTILNWFDKNHNKMQLNKPTERRIEELLFEKYEE